MVQRQVGFADRLLLAKCDIAAPEVIAELSARLSAINPRAPQLRLLHGRADPDTLLGIGGFQLDSSLLAGETQAPRRFTPLAAEESLRWARRPAAKRDEIGACLLETGEVDLLRIDAFVQALIDGSSEFSEIGFELLRYKGILAIANEERKLIFQGVERVAGFDYGEAWAPGEQRRSRIVLIGRHLPEERLREAFLRCAQTPL